MSQAPHSSPTVGSNAANNRQQVPLRDYLNARVAPFLKKAITESLDAEAEFPLQWLGECLIHQSILYEGNPDRTKIRERFLYIFEDPKPQESVHAEAPLEPVQSTPTVVSQELPAQQPIDLSMHEAADVETEPTSSTQVQEVAIPQVTGVQEVPAINGVKEDGGGESHGAEDDTEMGGTI